MQLFHPVKIMTVFLLLLLAGACASNPAVAPDTEFRIRHGESVRIAPGDVTVRFDAVTSDSRCPRGVNCVWQGDATVALTVSDESGSESIVLHTSGGPDRPTEAVARGFRFALVGLEPQPEAGGSIPSGEYVAVLRATRT